LHINWLCIADTIGLAATEGGLLKGSLVCSAAASILARYCFMVSIIKCGGKSESRRSGSNTAVDV
jgi:hypothetical protein